MNINSTARARLYALTAVACAIWLFQNCVEANASGDLLSWSNIILSICLIIVTGYCAVNAVLGWNTKSADTEDPPSRPHRARGAARRATHSHHSHLRGAARTDCRTIRSADTSPTPCCEFG